MTFKSYLGPRLPLSGWTFDAPVRESGGGWMCQGQRPRPFIGGDDASRVTGFGESAAAALQDAVYLAGYAAGRWDRIEEEVRRAGVGL